MRSFRYSLGYLGFRVGRMLRAKFRDAGIMSRLAGRTSRAGVHTSDPGWQTRTARGVTSVTRSARALVEEIEQGGGDQVGGVFWHEVTGRQCLAADVVRVLRGRRGAT